MSRIKLRYLFTIHVLITRPIGFDIAIINADTTLKKHRDKVVSTLFQGCFNVEDRLCVNVVKRWKSGVRFCLIFSVGSFYFNIDSQRWNNVDSELKCWLGYNFISMLFQRGLNFSKNYTETNRASKKYGFINR